MAPPTRIKSISASPVKHHLAPILFTSMGISNIEIAAAGLQRMIWDEEKEMSNNRLGD